MPLTTQERRRFGMAYQVVYEGCLSPRGPCGATECGNHQAPLVCEHYGVKRDAPEVDAKLDGAAMLRDYNDVAARDV